MPARIEKYISCVSNTVKAKQLLKNGVIVNVHIFQRTPALRLNDLSVFFVVLFYLIHFFHQRAQMLFPNWNCRSSAVFLKDLLVNCELLSKCQRSLQAFKVHPVMPVGSLTEQPQSETAQAQPYL